MNQPRQLQQISSQIFTSFKVKTQIDQQLHRQAHPSYLNQDIIYGRLFYRALLIFAVLYFTTYAMSGWVNLFISHFNAMNLSTLVIVFLVMGELGFKQHIYRNSRWNLMIILSGLILAGASFLKVML